MNFHGGFKGNKDLKIIDFSVNIPPIEISSVLRHTLIKTIDCLYDYPEIDGETCKRVIAKYLSCDSDEIIIGNGATELIYLVARAMPFETIMILEPTFSEYRRAFELNSVKAKSHIYSTVDHLVCEISASGANAIILCSPNNPTGEMMSLEDILEIFKKVNQPNFTIVVDESFIDFVDCDRNQHEEILRQMIRNHPLFVIRSLTKTYSVPGLRMGYGLGSREIVSKLHEHKEPWSLNRFALEALPVLLDDKEHLKNIVSWCTEEKRYLQEAFNGINHLKYKIGLANFYLIEVKEASELSLVDALLKKGIYIRPCHDFIGMKKGTYRLTIRMREDNEKLVKALEEAIYEVI